MNGVLPSPRTLRRFVLFSLAALASASAPARAQDVPDPKVALPILLKVITYDRNFAARGSGEFLVLVVSEPAQAPAREEVLSLLRTLKLTTVQSRPLRFASAEFKDEASLAARLNGARPAAILAAPGISAPGVQLLADAARKLQLYSLALDVSMVERSLALGVVAREGKPQIVINLTAAKAVGASFESAVLKFARLVQ